MSRNKEGSNLFTRREILFGLGVTGLATACKVSGLNKISETPPSTATDLPPTATNVPPVTATDLPPTATNVPPVTATAEMEAIHQPRWTVEQVEAIGPGHVKQYELNDTDQFTGLMISAGAYGPLQLTDEYHPACYDNQPFQCNALVASTIESIGTETGRASFLLSTPNGGILVPASENGDTWKNEPIINDYLSEVIPPGLLQTHNGKQLDVVQLFDIGIDQDNQIVDGQFDRVALVHEGTIVAVHHVGAQMDGYTQLQVAEPGIMFGTDSPLAQTDPDQNLELIVSVINGGFTAAYYPYRLNSELPGLINTDASATDGFGSAGHWKLDALSGGEFVWQAGEAPATATPEPIKPSEIDPFDPEIRMYHLNQDMVVREIPYGVYDEAPGIHNLSTDGYYDEAGLKEYYLSAVLVDEVSFDESDDSLTYPLGIPDASGNLNTFYLKEFVSGAEGEHFHVITPAYNTGKGARASIYESYSKYPLDEVLPWLDQIVGRQMLFVILTDENGGSEELRNFTFNSVTRYYPDGVMPDNVQPTDISPLNPEACGEDERCTRLTMKTNNRLNGFLETNDALRALINESPSQYSEQTIIPQVHNKFFPTPPRS